MKTADETTTDIEALVAEVADRFTEEVTQGVSPNIEEYAERHPEIAGIIRQVFPALAVLDSSTPILQPHGIEDRSVTGQLGDFRILGEIGRGGMGVVYDAEQISIGRHVALKVLPFAALFDGQQLNRFKNEARAAGTLDHPNIVSVHSVGTERGVHYYAMQLVEGQSLAEVIGELRIAERGLQNEEAGSDSIDPISQSEIRNPQAQIDTGPVAALPTVPIFEAQDRFCSAAQLGVQAAQALDHAHQNGIVHRDVKPANLLVNSAGKLWVTDFGLARIESDASFTMTGDIVGTLRYMSPEQAQATRAVLDHRTDIYSLGATLYELLTLQPAFDSENRQELLRKIAQDEPISPGKINPSIPRDLVTIVGKAMEKRPEARYATAQALADDLHCFLDDKPIQAKRPSLVRRLGKWTRRHRTLTATAIVAVLLGLLATAGIAMRNAREVRETERLANEAFAGVLTAIEAEDYALAEGKLGEAQAHMAQQPGATRELSDKIRRLRVELERLQSLIELVDQPTHHGYPNLFWTRERVGPAREALAQYGVLTTHIKYPNLFWTREWVGPAREALERYGVLNDPQWTSRLEQSLLPPERQSDVRKGAYRLLVLLAHDKIPRPADKPGEDVAARQSLKYLDIASSFHPPTRVCHYLRGKAHRSLGEDDAAEAADAIAEKTPATIALDHFIPGYDAVDDDKEEAIRQFQAALRVEPDHYRSLFSLGLASDDVNPEAALMAFFGCTTARPDDTRAHGNRLSIYMEMSQEDNAIAEAEAIARQSWRKSHRGEGWCQLGKIYLEKEQYESALAAFNRAIEILEGLGVDSPFVRGRKAYAYNGRGLVYAKIGELDKAIRDYTNAMRFDPEQSNSYFFRACAYIEKDEYNLAIADCTEVIRLDPNLAEAYAHRGMAYRRIGEPDKAIADCSKAIELDPQLPRGYINRACAYNAKGEHNLAIADCTEAIRLDPETAEAYNNRGIAHMQNGDFDLAIADYSDAIRLDPKSAMAYSNRSYVYAGTGEYNLAIADCTEAIRLDPEYATPYFNRGRQFYRRGELDKALADLNKGIQLDSNCGPAIDDRGHVYLLQGELDKAIADHTKAIELDQNAASYHNRANAYWDKGELDKALADFDKVIQHDPEDPFTIAHRAMLHQDRGDVEKAVADIRRAMELRPDAYASYVHARILLSDGNVDEYCRACATMLDQFGDTKIPEAAYLVVWTCALVPDAVEDPRRIVELAEMAVGAAPKKNSYVTALGAALCRAGQYEEAIQRLSTAATEYENRSDRKSRSGLAYTWFWLAIANERLGHHSAAEQWFEKAAGLADRLMAEHENGTNRLSWHRRLTLRLFREEAGELIGMKDEG